MHQKKENPSIQAPEHQFLVIFSNEGFLWNLNLGNVWLLAFLLLLLFLFAPEFGKLTRKYCLVLIRIASKGWWLIDTVEINRNPCSERWYWMTGWNWTHLLDLWVWNQDKTLLHWTLNHVTGVLWSFNHFVNLNWLSLRRD